MSLRAELRGGASAAAVAARLDALGAAARVAEVRGLGPRDLARLWELAAGAALALEHFVPPGLPPGTAVRHFGINSLPLARRFEKRFLRPADGRARLFGYNHQALMRITGPGYFAVDPPERGDELAISYLEVPPARPRPDWPEVRDNERGLSRLVYGRMRDRMRRVSAHVSIGRAYRDGKPLSTWFALVREDGSR